VTVSTVRGAKGNQRTGQVNQREIMGRDLLPANAQCAEVVVPAVRAFHYPSSRAAAPATKWILPSATDVRDDPPSPDLLLAVLVVVTLVEAEVSRAARPARRAQGHSIEGARDHPLVMDIRTRERHGEWDAPAVG